MDSETDSSSRNDEKVQSGYLDDEDDEPSATPLPDSNTPSIFPEVTNMEINAIEDVEASSSSDEASSDGTVDYTASDCEETSGDNLSSNPSVTGVPDSYDNAIPPSVTMLLNNSQGMDQATREYLAKALAHVEETVSKKFPEYNTADATTCEDNMDSETQDEQGYTVTETSIIDPVNENPVIKKTYTCDTCGATRPFLSSLKAHMLSHTKEKTFGCNLCSKKFRHPHSVLGHIKKVHEAEKPHACSYCDEKFRLPTQLKSHIKSHDPDYKKGLIWPCDECGRSFRAQGVLKVHKLRHAGIKPFKCEQCGGQFYTEYELKQHLTVHTGIKPYKCEHCQKCFRKPTQLNAHLKRHTGDLKYHCEKCGKR